MGNSPLITVEETAKLLGVDPLTLRYGIIQGLIPFGVAIKCTKSYRYIIVRERFEKWMKGELMECPHENNSISLLDIMKKTTHI